MSAVEILKEVLPFVATTLGGPLAGIAAKFVTDKMGLPPDTVENVIAMLKGTDPSKLNELKQLDQDFQVKMAELGYENLQKIEELNASVVIEVNKTMQTEASAEHWPSYSWRPFIGFCFGVYINSLWLLPLFKVTPVIMGPDIVLAIGGILGVASYFRGKAQADPQVSNTSQITMKG